MYVIYFCVHITCEYVIKWITDFINTPSMWFCCVFSSETFTTNGGSIIRWDYIQRLHDLQTREGLHCGNKLTKHHVNFQNHKMKVSLCVQTFSASVADSLAFACERLQHDNFQNSQETESFIRLMDRLFDLMTIATPHGIAWKAPHHTKSITKRLKSKWLLSWRTRRTSSLQGSW